jgi:hypothetical protein
MARTHGKDAVFSIKDSGATLRNLSAYIDSVAGLPGARALSDVTGFTDQGERSIPGLQSAAITVSGSFDSTAVTGPNVVFNGLRNAVATSTFEYGPEGSAAGKVKFTGECWLETYTVDAKVTDKVPFQATLKLDGVVTTTVYP